MKLYWDPIVYIMQAVNIANPVYFLAKVDTN